MARSFPTTWTTELKANEAWPSWVLYLYDKNGDPVTSGFDIICMVRKSPSSSNIEKEFSLGDGLTQDGNKITWSGDVDLSVRTYVVDVMVTIGSDDYYTKTGLISVVPNVSR